MTDSEAAMFRELCVDLGFCSLSPDGEDRVLAQLPFRVDKAARAVFAAEGLDFDAYDREGVREAVRECIARHLEKSR